VEHPPLEGVLISVRYSDSPSRTFDVLFIAML
jgi:hypothetical protein